jgi:hypothetical protein
MKFRYIIIFLSLSCCISVYSQDKQPDFSMFLNENIEFTALKPFFYLIRQEYVLSDETGKAKTRGGNDFYGKAYTIGVLDEDSKLWFPTYVRFPWKIDDTFDKKIITSFRPECSFFGRKNYSEQDYFKTKIQAIDERNLLTFLLSGKIGITLEKSQQNNGTLVVFYSSVASPDDFKLISYSLMFLDDIIWNSDGIADIEELHLGNNKIIGGALFSRNLSPGFINWKLSGFYLPVKDKWVLVSLNKQ